MTVQSNTPRLFLSAPHPCPYLYQTATTLVLDPNYLVDNSLFTIMLHAGFRRSGHTLYRPHCRNCNSCKSVRIPAHEFTPNRAQRRTLKRNADLSVTLLRTQFSDEHFDLYKRYQFWRHTGDIMDHDDPELYTQYMVDSPIGTVLFEFRLDEQLVCVSICDMPSDGLSAVYTFFEPELQYRSLGTFSILKQLEYVRQLQLDWLYLGYWIEDCKKMSYKTNFKPLYGYINQEWELIEQ